MTTPPPAENIGPHKVYIDTGENTINRPAAPTTEAVPVLPMIPDSMLLPIRDADKCDWLYGIMDSKN